MSVVTSREQALDILGLKHNEMDIKRIKHTYKTLALSLHPDRLQRERDAIANSHQPQMSFHHIQQAYEYLLNGQQEDSRTLFKVAHGGKSISAMAENIESVQLGMTN